MQDKDPNEDKRQQGGDGGFNWKGMILLFVALGLFALAFGANGISERSKNLTFAEFKEKVAQKKIYVDPNANPPKLLRLVQKDGSMKQSIEGFYEVDDLTENGGEKYKAFSTPLILDYVEDELKEGLASADPKLEISDLPTESDGLGMMLMSFYLPVF